MVITKRFNYNTSLLEFNGEVNSGFAKIKLSVMSEEIANGTQFSKEVIDKRISGLNYIPIVGEYKEDDKTFGSHGGKLEISDDGLKFISTTRPYGVVIANTARWEDIKQKNGETIPYLVCEAYVWYDRHKEELDCLFNGKEHNQSMEVNLLDGFFEESSWVYRVKDFEFSALCLLAPTVKPAFPEAKVSVDYSNVDFKADYKEMITALNTYLTNNKMEVFSLENEKLDNVEETTEEFEENQEETLETETVEEFEEETKTTETEEIEIDEEEVVEEESEEEFTETVEEIQEDVESVDYEKLYNDLLVEFEQLTEKTKELEEFQSNVVEEQKQAVLQDFSSRLDENELSSIDVDNLTIEQIEEKCFALVGKKQAQFSATEKPNKKVTINFNQTKSTNDWMSVLADEVKKIN